MIQRFKQVYDRSLHQYVMVSDDEGDYYFADDVDRELAAASTDKHDEMMSLRERAGELEKNLESYRSSTAIFSTAAVKWSERERLLLEAVRWCMENGAMKCSDGTILENGASYGSSDSPADIPAHLAPLIAEATK